MFFKRRLSTTPFVSLRPSRAHQQRLHNDQLPFLARKHFSAMPKSHIVEDSTENLSVFSAFLHIIDLFGVFPFVMLPSIFVDMGFLSVPVILCVVILQIYTSFLLSKCWTMAETLEPSIVLKYRYPYAAIAELTYGRYVSILVTTLVNVGIFAQYIPNIVTAAQNIELVVERVSDSELKISYCYILIFIGVFVCPFMWLGSPKHMYYLTLISAFVVIVVVILLWYCLLTAPQLGKPFEGFNMALPDWSTVVTSYGLLAFQFDIHSMLLTLQIDMQNKTQVSSAVLCGTITTTIVSIIGAIIATYKFGSHIEENVLTSVPRSIALFVLLVLISFQLCSSAVAGSSALFLQIENLLKIPEEFSYKRVIVRSMIFAFEVFLAEFLPSFDSLMDITGGTLIGPLVFILPPLIYQRLYHMKRVHDRVTAEATYGTVSLDLNQYPIGSMKDISLLPEAPKSENIFHYIYRRTINCLRQLYYEFSYPVATLLFGITATTMSVYFNFFDIGDLFENNSLCFGWLTDGSS